MEHLRQTYEDFVLALNQADGGELREFNDYLESIQEEDSGPNGELARAVQCDVQARTGL